MNIRTNPDSLRFAVEQLKAELREKQKYISFV